MSTRATLDAVSRDLADAHHQARQAYAFGPSSYAYSAMVAANAARLSFEAYRVAILEQEDGE